MGRVLLPWPSRLTPTRARRGGGLNQSQARRQPVISPVRRPLLDAAIAALAGLSVAGHGFAVERVCVCVLGSQGQSRVSLGVHSKGGKQEGKGKATSRRARPKPRHPHGMFILVVPLCGRVVFECVREDVRNGKVL